MGVELTALHWIYITFIIFIIGFMVMRRDTTLICIVGIFLLAVTANGSISASLSSIFNSFIFAITELLSTILVISIIVAMSKTITNTGINDVMISPFAKIIRTPALAYWTIGIVMMIISWFFWPSPAVALLGAVLLPVALRAGLPALGVAMALNLFGHGIALSGDYVIQAAPKLTADAAGLPVGDVISASIPLVMVMGGVTTVAGFYFLKRDMKLGKLNHTTDEIRNVAEVLLPADKSLPAGEPFSSGELLPADNPSAGVSLPADKPLSAGVSLPTDKLLSAGVSLPADKPLSAGVSLPADKPLSAGVSLPAESAQSKRLSLNQKRLFAFMIPFFFALDVACMYAFHLQGGDATALIGGTAIFILLIITLVSHKNKGLEQTTSYFIEGFQFGFKVFGPVIPIAAFFYLGDSGFEKIIGDFLPDGSNGIVNDLGLALANVVPLSKEISVITLTTVGAITGLDGSGFSGISLAGSIASLFATAIGGGAATLTALGQVAAIWVGGGTIIPWALIPAAAICNVDPFELARRNMKPVAIGLIVTTIVAMFLI